MLTVIHPRLRRGFALRHGAAIAAVITTAVPAPASARLGPIERQVVVRMNAVRAGEGLPRLRVDHRLARAAALHSRDMLRSNFFGHQSSNGAGMGQRVSAFTPARMLGEDIAWLAGTEAPRQADVVMASWLASPPHRASIVNPRFRRVGIGRRAGRLGSLRVAMFTADFSSRR